MSVDVRASGRIRCPVGRRPTRPSDDDEEFRILPNEGREFVRESGLVIVLISQGLEGRGTLALLRR